MSNVIHQFDSYDFVFILLLLLVNLMITVNITHIIKQINLKGVLLTTSNTFHLKITNTFEKYTMSYMLHLVYKFMSNLKNVRVELELYFLFKRKNLSYIYLHL